MCPHLTGLLARVAGEEELAAVDFSKTYVRQPMHLACWAERQTRLTAARFTYRSYAFLSAVLDGKVCRTHSPRQQWQSSGNPNNVFTRCSGKRPVLLDYVAAT
jgi:hypothetical protein